MGERAPKLGPHEHVVAAWPEYSSGPGWANALVVVIVDDGNGRLRREALQPQHQTDPAFAHLFQVAAHAAIAMRAAASRVMQPKVAKRRKVARKREANDG